MNGMKSSRLRLGYGLAVVPALLVACPAAAQSVAIDTTQRYQSIDGFGTCLSGSEASTSWWQNLFFDDLEASIVRVDITPTFTSTYRNVSYCSPWFGQAAPLSLDNGGNGPDGTRTRRYTSASDYSTTFGGCSAPIAVMGTDIDTNAAYFDFTTPQAVPGLIAQLGKMKAAQLGGFKLYASMWSPAPWVKVSSGNTYGGGASPLPTAGVAYPFIWGGNFAGGKIDTSGAPLPQFDDGTGPTSALTQFARGLAAFLHGFQNAYGVQFYAISIQNELNFEEFYNSGTYPLASDYIAALKAARAELDAHTDLAAIKIIGPEDLLGGDPYSLWQYGSGATETDKNLHYLQDIAADSTASAAISGFAIHGYAPDGVSSAGASPQSWDWWANGWTTSPGGGIPATVQGFTAYQKPSWMTETSGEDPEWLASSTSGGFPDSGAFSLVLKIAQALTTGQESAWLYWQLTDGSPSSDSDVQTLTDATQLANDPKYVAAKHFFKFIRPGAVRVAATVSGSSSVLAGAFALDAAKSLTVVLVNEGSAAATVTATLGTPPAGLSSFDTYTSSSGSLWQSGTARVSGGQVSVPVPAYGVVTLYGTGTQSGGDDAGAGGFDGGFLADAGAGLDGGFRADAGSASSDASAGKDATVEGADAATGSSSGGGSSGSSSGSLADDGGSGGGSESDATAAGASSPSSSSSGCGCRTAGAGAGATPFGVLGAVALLGLGRRRRHGHAQR
jgi:MYXO-CTERM domain-containing protein